MKHVFEGFHRHAVTKAKIRFVATYTIADEALSWQAAVSLRGGVRTLAGGGLALPDPRRGGGYQAAVQHDVGKSIDALDV
ncbi:MAG TPA: hypothetical protein VF457_07015 [Burkholderiaceae bacterium]